MVIKLCYYLLYKIKCIRPREEHTRRLYYWLKNARQLLASSIPHCCLQHLSYRICSRLLYCVSNTEICLIVNQKKKKRLTALCLQGHENIWIHKQRNGVQKLQKRRLKVSLQLKFLADLLHPYSLSHIILSSLIPVLS